MPPPGRATSKKGGLSAGTQEFLAEVLNETGASRRLRSEVLTGAKQGTDWVGALSTRTPNRHVSSTMRQSETLRKQTIQKHQPRMMHVGAAKPGKKMADTIFEETGRYEREKFTGGGPVVDREAEKDRLALANEVGRKEAARIRNAQLAKQRAPPPAACAPSPPRDPRELLIDQLVDEVRERREWLEDMRARGLSAPYEEETTKEIRERLSRLRTLGY
ncbi:unnamed protein product [Pedinophyceae sp. YPF-701]|nr:unnamed protein product [Pedinophyceae sp. YPF-701]